MTSKREQIVLAALRRYRTRGVCGTTLKDVAAEAGIPLGNLYYYFKTRDELLHAVLDACEAQLRALLDRFSPLAPAEWFAAYFDWLTAQTQDAARYGCPFGTLAAELRALGDPAAPRAARTVQLYLGALRNAAAACQLSQGTADDLFLAVQGAYTVARTLNDPELFRESVERLRDGLPVLDAR